LVKKDNTVKVVLEKDLEDLKKDLGQSGGGEALNIEEKQHHNFVHPSKIKDISKIDYECMESYPCQHDCEVVAKDGTIHKTRLDGKQIYNFYKKNDLHIPSHFVIYSKNNE